MCLTFTCILYGMAPERVPFAYGVQSAIYLPFRIWTYKRKAWHYFLFGTPLVFCRPQVLILRLVLLREYPGPRLDVSLPLLNDPLHRLLGTDFR